LAAIAALLLLLLLLKKKAPVPEQVEETAGSDSAALDEVDGYISEYGLSDNVRPMDDEDQEDLPQEGASADGGDGELENASEINPDDFEGSNGPPSE
jgi:hypothetical protein